MQILQIESFKFTAIVMTGVVLITIIDYQKTANTVLTTLTTHGFKNKIIILEGRGRVILSKNGLVFRRNTQKIDE
jgi:hypothetical protein